jgi:hypothetical protein
MEHKLIGQNIGSDLKMKAGKDQNASSIPIFARCFLSDVYFLDGFEAGSLAPNSA